MGRPKLNLNGSDCRTRLLKTYIKLAAWHGAQNVTLLNLARETGVAFNSAHYHFQGGLLKETFDFILSERSLWVEKKMNHWLQKGERNALRAYVKALFHWASENHDRASFLFFAHYAASTHLSLKKTWVGHRFEEQIKIKRLLTESMGAEKYSKLKHLDSLSTKIQHMLLALLEFHLTEPSKAPEENWDLCWDSMDAIIKSHSQKPRA